MRVEAAGGVSVSSGEESHPDLWVHPVLNELIPTEGDWFDLLSYFFEEYQGHRATVIQYPKSEFRHCLIRCPKCKHLYWGQVGQYFACLQCDFAEDGAEATRAKNPTNPFEYGEIAAVLLRERLRRSEEASTGLSQKSGTTRPVVAEQEDRKGYHPNVKRNSVSFDLPVLDNEEGPNDRKKFWIHPRFNSGLSTDTSREELERICRDRIESQRGILYTYHSRIWSGAVIICPNCEHLWVGNPFTNFWCWRCQFVETPPIPEINESRDKKMRWTRTTRLFFKYEWLPWFLRPGSEKLSFDDLGAVRFGAIDPAGYVYRVWSQPSDGDED